MTTSDVEASIHSHPTMVEISNGSASFGNAREMGPLDAKTFSKYPLNLIAGPLGPVGRFMEGTIPNRPNGVVFFRGNQPKPILEIKSKAIRNILQQ